MTIKGVTDIYVGSYYKPTENDEDSLLELWSSLSKIPQNSIICLLGDFNLPCIDWTTESSKSNEDFMERIQHFNLQQMVTMPTRLENILDLFLTNTPSLVQNTETLPSLGTSDNDIVFHEVHIKIGRPFQPKRPIRKYRRTNWEHFKTDLSEFGNTFIKSDHTDPNFAWNMFKIEFNRLSSMHIPTKMGKSRSDLPWMTPQIHRLLRKRDKMYTKLKHPNSSVTTKQFKDLKSNIQKRIGNAYWLYIESVIFTGDSQPCGNKKFYSFVKHNKTEQCGVALLKYQGLTYTDPVDKATTRYSK